MGSAGRALAQRRGGPDHQPEDGDLAALDAARSLDGPLDVVSDSTYVVNCFRDGWWEKWLARGWKGAAKQQVANQDLWEPLVGLYRAVPGRLRFRWVKGHSADPFNDLVDRLAVAAATSQRGAEGVRPPDGRVPGARRRPLGPSPLGPARLAAACLGPARPWQPGLPAPAHSRRPSAGEGGTAGAGTGATLRSGRASDAEALLRLWQVAGARPGVTDDVAGVRLLMTRDPMALIVAEVAGDAGAGTGGSLDAEPVGTEGSWWAA